MKICNNQEISLFTEFTTLSWTIILLIQIGVLCLYTWFYKMLTKSGMSKLNDVIQSSLNVCLRALINKGSKKILLIVKLTRYFCLQYQLWDWSC